MGETFADVVLVAKDRRVKARLLVDTGAVYSWIRAETLHTLGVEPVREMSFETIEGKLAKRKIGFIELECDGERAPTVVVFGKDRDGEVLGLHALEGLAMEVDPVNRKLRKLQAVKALQATQAFSPQGEFSSEG